MPFGLGTGPVARPSTLPPSALVATVSVLMVFDRLPVFQFKRYSGQPFEFGQKLLLASGMVPRRRSGAGAPWPAFWHLLTSYPESQLSRFTAAGRVFTTGERERQELVFLFPFCGESNNKAGLESR